MLTLNEPTPMGGNITKLGPYGAMSPLKLAAMLGFGYHILAGGYALCALDEPVRWHDFQFDGLTLRSGGREGLPLADAAADRSRTRVYSRMETEYAPTELDEMRRKWAATAALTGPERVIKICPLLRKETGNPAIDYPMGGGAGQWRLTDAHSFRPILIVDAKGLATTIPGWSESLAENAPLDGRTRVARYLPTA